MNIDVDALLDKWADARNTISVLEKRVENYKKVMKQYLARNNLTKYENDFFIVRQGTQNRSFVTKKNVPEDVWDMYAKPQKIDFLTLTEKKSSTSSSKLKSTSQEQSFWGRMTLTRLVGMLEWI